MRLVIKALVGVLLIVLTAGLHFAFSQILPFPANKVNVIYGVILTILLITQKGSVVWLSFILHYIVELYTTTPFGIVLFSGTMSTLIMYWLATELFTNPRTIVAIGLGAVGIVLYRLAYSGMLLLFSIFDEQLASIWSIELLGIYLWELLFTTLFIVLLHLLYLLIARYRRT